MKLKIGFMHILLVCCLVFTYSFHTKEPPITIKEKNEAVKLIFESLLHGGKCGEERWYDRQWFNDAKKIIVFLDKTFLYEAKDKRISVFPYDNSSRPFYDMKTVNLWILQDENNEDTITIQYAIGGLYGQGYAVKITREKDRSISLSCIHTGCS
jgi:hypothetical protein